MSLWIDADIEEVHADKIDISICLTSYLERIIDYQDEGNVYISIKLKDLKKILEEK